jgi:aldehyde dehydrogenase (NAD+)
MAMSPPDIRIARPDRIHVGGQWIEPHGKRRIELVSPHNERTFLAVAEADETDVDAAVAAARRAFDQGPWPRMTPMERAGYLRRLSQAIEPRLPELARAWTEQTGALAVAAPFVIGGGKFWLDYYAGLAADFDWVVERPLNDGPGRGYVVREPVGVVAAIAPWNNPFGIMTGKLAPALVAGCCVIMKPAPETPLEAYIIAEAAEAAGLPEGVLNLITAQRDVSDYLVRHRGVDKVSFTGSVAAGGRIASVCGERIARCTLELGGKSAAVVLPDYDIGVAAKLLARTITMSAGQICATLSRAVVPRGSQARFVEAVAAEMKTITVGDPYDPATQMGPVAMKRQLDRVEGYVDVARREGAQLITGGARPRHLDRGFYYEPTLFANVAPGMRIAQEEIFGPVLATLTYDTEEQAIALANDSNFGLFGAVFTNDAKAAWRVARGVRTGTMCQNAFRFDTAMPFGGFKQSGIGREGGREGLATYTELKAVILSPQ